MRAGCGGVEGVGLVEAAFRVWYVVGVEEGQTEFVCQGVVGGAIDCGDLAGEGLGRW